MPTVSQALAIAFAQHQAGHLAVAEEIYQRVLAAEPDQPDAWHLWGMVAMQRGQPDAAIERIGRAVSLTPNAAAYQRNLGDAYRALRRFDDAVACYRRALESAPADVASHNKLGMALRSQGKPADAVSCYQRALELDPKLAEVWNNLGNAWADQRRSAEAVDCFRRALELMPNDARFHGNLGLALADLGRTAEAIACQQAAIGLQPDHFEAHNNLGTVLLAEGKLSEAIECFRRTVELNSRHAEAYSNLGNALRRKGDFDGALAACQQAVTLKPELANAHNNLGNVWKDVGRLDEAVACYRRAVELKPDFAEAHNNLGNACKDQGLIDEAIACYERALQAKPDFVHPLCNLVYTLHFCADGAPQRIDHALRRFNDLHARPLAAAIRTHDNDRTPDRRLRVGYVSPDFRRHPVGRFLLPLLEAHDHQQFEIVCYSSVELADEITDRCQAAADVWRDVRALSDEQLAERIRADRVDVLVDLTMHMAHSRLLVFARKPAPVQVTYLAYCGTTGLAGMDYRLTDPYLDPPGGDERFYTERSIRLPETYWCYRPLDETPPINGLPALGAGDFTFGSLNNFCKLSPAALDAWSRLLRAVPKSQLLLHALRGPHRDRIRKFFAARDVSPERLTFVDFQPAAGYFRIYQQIDVALDPFPYGGGTTTCDALWMGVPVVTLAGPMAVGRGGVSILSNLGMPELIARDPQHYIEIAADLASDLPRLAGLRATLRDRMQRSPLTNAPRFARHVEQAYREMWRERMSGQGTGVSGEW
jgi:predicted O-linked N-acetylglucosamine transferase (SPINDLY family)